MTCPQCSFTGNSQNLQSNALPLSYTPRNSQNLKPTLLTYIVHALTHLLHITPLPTWSLWLSIQNLCHRFHGLTKRFVISYNGCMLPNEKQPEIWDIFFNTEAISNSCILACNCFPSFLNYLGGGPVEWSSCIFRRSQQTYLLSLAGSYFVISYRGTFLKEK